MLRQDLSFAFRQFRKSPVFAFTAIVSLMLGIGATTAVFSVVYAILMSPYPYRGADRLVYLNVMDKAGNNRGIVLPAHQMQLLKRANCFESVVVIQDWS